MSDMTNENAADINDTAGEQAVAEYDGGVPEDENYGSSFEAAEFILGVKIQALQLASQVSVQSGNAHPQIITAAAREFETYLLSDLDSLI